MLFTGWLDLLNSLLQDACGLVEELSLETLPGVLAQGDTLEVFSVERQLALGDVTVDTELLVGEVLLTVKFRMLGTFFGFPEIPSVAGSSF